jgi:hypothetical protein
MKIYINLLSVVPIRAEPSEKSEMVSQLLFGESYTVLQQTEQWYQIQCEHDLYIGWINEKQFFENVIKPNISNSFKTLSLCHVATMNNMYFPLLMGSTLLNFDGIQSKLDKKTIIYNGEIIEIQSQRRDKNILEKIAKMYLNAPYLWGGRTPFGIDCSGFLQVCFSYLGINLPRDAYQQVEKGVLIDFVQECTLGDVAFFVNNEGKIIHTGLLLNDGKIIHASGKVRIDTLDHFGIYNESLKKYTHQLKVIKRIL